MNNIESRIIKDTYFLFERLGFEVYTNTNTSSTFVLSMARCVNCGTPWNFNISQCFFCGSISPFLMKDATGKYISSTNASKKRFYPCINPDCLSNQANVLDMIQSKYKGVFDRKSPFNTTLENCIKCGNDVYTFNTALIKIEISENEHYEFNEQKKYDGAIIRFYKTNKVNFSIFNKFNTLLKILKDLETDEMSELDFKAKIESIIKNPQSFSFHD